MWCASTIHKTRADSCILSGVAVNGGGCVQNMIKMQVLKGLMFVSFPFMPWFYVKDVKKAALKGRQRILYLLLTRAQYS